MIDYPDGYSNEWRDYKMKDKEYPETIIYTDKERISCTGAQNDHPRVYYSVPEVGHVVCGYCDIKFARKKPNELSG